MTNCQAVSAPTEADQGERAFIKMMIPGEGAFIALGHYQRSSCTWKQKTAMRWAPGCNIPDFVGVDIEAIRFFFESPDIFDIIFAFKPTGAQAPEAFCAVLRSLGFMDLNPARTEFDFDLSLRCRGTTSMSGSELEAQVEDKMRELKNLLIQYMD